MVLKVCAVNTTAWKTNNIKKGIKPVGHVLLMLQFVAPQSILTYRSCSIYTGQVNPLHPNDEGNRFFRNIGNHSPNDGAS